MTTGLPHREDLSEPRPGRIPLNALRDEGYLQEANRQFFHPLGLALCVVTYDHGGQELVVLDDRSDPEGWHFLNATGDDREQFGRKARAVFDQFMQRIGPRTAALGWMIQPVEHEPPPVTADAKLLPADDAPPSPELDDFAKQDAPEFRPW